MTFGFLLQLEPYMWCGNFDELADAIIRQHAVQSGLTVMDENLARWIEFCSVHVDHPISFVLFAELATKLQRPLKEGQFSTEEVNIRSPFSNQDSSFCICKYTGRSLS